MPEESTCDDRALRADQLQYELGQGAAWSGLGAGHLRDRRPADRPAYPEWCRRVVAETGIRSSLSQQLFTDPAESVSLGALKLFMPRPQAFDPDTRGEALAFAAHAAIALHSAQNQEQLRSGMATRTLIGQAEGILMERLKITADEALGLLSRLSQQSHRKLREMARDLVETGEIPQS